MESRCQSRTHTIQVAWTVIYSITSACLPCPVARSSLIIWILALDLLTAGMWLVALTLLLAVSVSWGWQGEFVASILFSLSELYVSSPLRSEVALRCCADWSSPSSLLFCSGAAYLIRAIIRDTTPVANRHGNTINLSQYPNLPEYQKQNGHGPGLEPVQQA